MHPEEPNVEPTGLGVGAVVKGRYVLERLLGEGGMGAVYLAKDLQGEHEVVAVKFLHEDLLGHDGVVARFYREFDLMKNISSPAVVSVFEAGEFEGRLFFVMEFIEGLSLGSLADRGPIDFETIRLLVVRICEGLEAVHASGVIHRDLKPDNILILPDGNVKITDFGVARPQDSNLTAYGEVVGTVTYIAPEIALGQQPTHAVDLYMLGVLLYEISVGEPPFRGETPAQLIWMHMRKAPVPPVEANPLIPGWLNRLILRLLEKRPEDRPANAREVITFIEQRNATGVLSPPVDAPGQPAPVVMPQPTPARANTGTASAANPRLARRTKSFLATVPLLIMVLSLLGVFLFAMLSVFRMVKDLFGM